MSQEDLTSLAESLMSERERKIRVAIVENGLPDKDSGRHLRRVEFGRMLKVEAPVA